MPGNPNPSVRLLRSLARLVGAERPARALLHRWQRRNPEVLERHRAKTLARLAERAGSLGAYVQWVMDIDDGSPWFQPEFAGPLGGFHPPGQRRTLRRDFPHDRVRADFLLLLLRDITARGVAGSLAELGVHRGRSACLLHHYCPERKLYLFDTFSGFAPQDFRRETVQLSYNQAQQFTDTTVAETLRAISPVNAANVLPVVGWFPGSVTPEIARESFALVHLDADLEAPIAAGLEFFWPRLAPGGFLVVHDYNAWPGARLAADRFRRQQPIAAVPMPDKSGSIVFSKP